MELLAHGLLDEINIAVHPILAGVGGPEDLLFQPDCRAKLDLTATRVLGSGVVFHTYAPATD